MKGCAPHVCKECGQEQIRHVKGAGGYRYFCACLEWARMMAVLEHARKRRGKRS